MLIELLTNNKKKKGPLFIIISWSKMRRNTDNPITHPSGWCWAPCAARLSTSDTGCERASVALRTPATPAPPADHEPSLNQSPDHESPDWTTDDMNGTGLKRWNASSHESVSVSVCVCLTCWLRLRFWFWRLDNCRSRYGSSRREFRNMVSWVTAERHIH